MSDSRDPVLAAIADLARHLGAMEVGLNGRLGALEAKLDSTAAALDAKLDSTAAALDAKIDSTAAALDAKIAALDGRMLKLRVELMGRLDEHSDTLTSIRDTMAASYAEADRARQISEHTRLEVRALADQVSLVQRQVHRLQSEMRELKGSP